MVKYGIIGPLAQLVERLICNEEATSSNLVGSTKRNIVGIKKMERFCGSQNRSAFLISLMFLWVVLF